MADCEGLVTQEALSKTENARYLFDANLLNGLANPRLIKPRLIELMAALNSTTYEVEPDLLCETLLSITKSWSANVLPIITKLSKMDFTNKKWGCIGGLENNIMINDKWGDNENYNLTRFYKVRILSQVELAEASNDLCRV